MESYKSHYEKTNQFFYLIIVKLEVITSWKEVIRLLVDIITCLAIDQSWERSCELWDLEVERNCDQPIILLIKFKGILNSTLLKKVILWLCPLDWFSFHFLFCFYLSRDKTPEISSYCVRDCVGKIEVRKKQKKKRDVIWGG